jgi:hypothetical protein
MPQNCILIKEKIIQSSMVTSMASKKLYPPSETTWGIILTTRSWKLQHRNINLDFDESMKKVTGVQRLGSYLSGMDEVRG